VVLILADDQGHGDLGLHGNPRIKTPHIDKLARDGVQLTDFHVCPVCSPTRACLMTGRYNYRTRVVDTFLGRSLMDPDELTLAEMLAAGGYRTGIFGKWHLGDNYPLRAMDQGFQEALVLKGGGLGQPSDVPGGGSYFNPVLQHNGKPERVQGYVSDVLTDAAMAFITSNQERPFFVYLPFNCPHGPLEVPDKYLKPYQAMNLSFSEFPKAGHPLTGKEDSDTTARVYGMVTNIDDNLGRLFAKLDELKLAENTIVVFLTDNGPQQVRYNSGMRARKGSVYEGGIRVPCFVRWPGQLQAGRAVETVAAHIDLAPTLLDLCGVAKPDKVALDGISLKPLLRGEKNEGPERTLFFQWHRGDVPERYRAFAARTERWKLVQAQGVNAGKLPDPPAFELFDLEKDPLEFTDVAAQHPDIVASLKKAYDDWFDDVAKSRGYAPPRIVLGSTAENPTTLTRQDWRGPQASWGPTGLGYWEVRVDKAAAFDVTLQFRAPRAGAAVRLVYGDADLRKNVETGATTCTFPGVKLPAGPGRLEAQVIEDGTARGVNYVDVKRLD
jgi:arylsulfatase A-like enzyme